jgi:nicotinamidase-related amidase
LPRSCAGAPGPRRRGTTSRVCSRPGPTTRVRAEAKHSGFYATSLAVVLDYLGVRRLILTGLTTPQCVLFTAADAHMRDFELVVPADCAAAAELIWHRQAFAFMTRFFDADTRASGQLALRRTPRERKLG